VRALYVAESENAALGVGDRLRDTLAIPVSRFDPLGGEQPPAGATAGSFAGAAGLLYLFGRGKGLPINFVRPREPKPPIDPNRRLLTWAGIAAGVLVLIGGIGGYALVAANQKKVDALQKQKKDLDEDLVRFDADERRIAAVDQWQKSEIVWLDEIYNLTARFPDVNKVKLTEMIAEPMPMPPQPGRPVDTDKPVAMVKLKGVTTDADSQPQLMRELVRDVARVFPTNRRGTNAGGRRQSLVEWGATYQLAHQDREQFAARPAFEAKPPDRGRNRNRGGGGMPNIGDFADMFNMGVLP
jgi:hypothetical protein